MCYITLIAQLLKNLPAVQETWVQFLDWEDPLEKEMATHSSILAWRVPWTEEPGRLQSMGSQTVGCDLATKPPPLLYNPLLSLFTLNAQIVSGLASRRLFQGDSCILLTYLQNFLSIYFLARSIPGSSCTFSDPALHSGTSPRYSSSLLWRVQVGKLDLGSMCAYCYWDFVASKPSQQTVPGNTRAYTHTSVHFCVSVGTVYKCHKFSPIAPILIQPSSICSSLLLYQPHSGQRNPTLIFLDMFII